MISGSEPDQTLGHSLAHSVSKMRGNCEVVASNANGTVAARSRSYQLPLEKWRQEVSQPLLAQHFLVIVLVTIVASERYLHAQPDGAERVDAALSFLLDADDALGGER